MVVSSVCRRCEEGRGPANVSWVYIVTVEDRKDTTKEENTCFVIENKRVMSKTLLHCMWTFLWCDFAHGLDSRDLNRYHDERLPPARRPPPFEEYIRDRAPPFDEHPPRYDSPSFPPPHHEDARHPAEGLRVEKKAETVPVESIFDAPGRESRPDRVSFGSVSILFPRILLSAF